jgi:YVTN family beta-propeller protein
MRPDGKVVYVTSEQDSQVFAIDTTSHEVLARITPDDRPRSIAFTPQLNPPLSGFSFAR